MAIILLMDVTGRLAAQGNTSLSTHAWLVVANGQEALLCLRRGNLDAAVLDMALWNSPHPSLRETLRQQPNLPILWLGDTSPTMPLDNLEDAALQVTLPKANLQMDELAEQIERLLWLKESRQRQAHLEQALQANESLNRLLLNANPQAMLLLDDQRRVLMANPSALGLMHADVGQTLLLPWPSASTPPVPATSPPHTPAMFHGVSEAQGLAVETLWWPIRNADGNLERIVLQLNPQGEAEANPAQAEAAQLEVDVRQRNLTLAKANLRLLYEMQERTRVEEDLTYVAKAVEQATEIILITDVAGQVQYANPAYQNTTGFSLADIQGPSTKDFQPLALSAAERQQLFQTLEQGQIWRGSLRLRTKDGDILETSATLSPNRDDQGHITHHVMVLRDTRQQRLMEHHLRQTQKLEAIGILAGGISHDFNNLLTPILGYADLLLLRMDSQHKDFEHLQRIRKAALRARDLVAQILLFSRRHEGHMSPMDMEGFMREAMRMIRSTLPSTVLIHQHYQPGLPMVLADANQLHTVLLNLCVNAHQAMAEGGLMEISLSKATLNGEIMEGQQVAGDFVVLEVQDSGVGMDEHVLSRLFEPFFTTKPLGVGTGMGLAAVYGIVRQHEGYMRVVSQPGKGATFSIYLPVYVKQQVSENNPKAEFPWEVLPQETSPSQPHYPSLARKTPEMPSKTPTTLWAKTANS